MLLPYEPVAFRVNIQAAGEEILPRAGMGKRPLATAGGQQGAAGGEPIELFQKEAALAAAAQTKLADKLLVPGGLTG